MDELRFLGIMILSDGRFAAYRDSLDSSFTSLTTQLRNIGLASTPLALTRGLRISVLPGLLFGCEMWGIDDMHAMLFRGRNPYKCNRLTPLYNILKKKLGLPPKASTAAVCQIF